MKSTAERLRSSYCVPKGAEWDAFGLIPLSGHYVTWLGGEPTLISGKFADRTEIPVPHFLDLLHDRIAAWRLEDDGFRPHPWMSSTMYEIQLPDYKSISIRDGEVTAWNDSDDNASLGLPMKGITTYTQLLTLIELIG